MLLKPPANAKQISDAYGQLRRCIAEHGLRFHRNIGWPSGNNNFTVYRQSRHRFWAMLLPRPSLYWCGYGLQDPRDNRSLKFTVQINPPRSPASRRGAFLQDEHGNTYLCHNGLLTKGHASLGKDEFIAEYNGDDVAQWSGLTDRAQSS